MGTRKNHLTEAVLMSTHNLCFEQKYDKNIRISIRNYLIFLVVKFSVYLNRLVFVMTHVRNQSRIQPANVITCPAKDSPKTIN